MDRVHHDADRPVDGDATPRPAVSDLSKYELLRCHGGEGNSTEVLAHINREGDRVPEQHADPAARVAFHADCGTRGCTS